jgi:hypothetical protein
MQRCAYLSIRNPTTQEVVFDACQCALPTSGDNGMTTVEKPCCTQAGLGCLSRIPGYVSSRLYITQEQSAAQYPADGTTVNTGCGDQEDDEEFWWTKYEQASEHGVWVQYEGEEYQSPTQQEFANFDGEYTYVAPVMGGDGTRRKGLGKTSSLLSSQVSDGKPSSEDYTVYITQVRRAQNMYSQGDEKYRGITVNRFEVKHDFLDRDVEADPGDVDNSEVGSATPVSGVADATYVNGFPSFVSLPWYLYNEELLSRGITVTSNGKAATADEEKHSVYILVEPASGMSLSGHKRLMASFSVWGCSSQLQGCYAVVDSAANIQSPYVPGNIIVPIYWMDETTEPTDKQIDDFKSILELSQTADYIVLIFPIVGGIGCIVGLIFSFKTSKKSIVRASLLNN